MKYAGGMFVACCDRRRLGLIFDFDGGLGDRISSTFGQNFLADR